MKWSFAFLVLFLVGSCNTSKEINYSEDQNLFQTWRHSHEEDTETYKVYRNQDFSFPPSRGRDAFTIKENGEFIHYEIGPVDLPVETQKVWEWQGKNTLFVVREVAGEEGMLLEILELGPDILKVKK